MERLDLLVRDGQWRLAFRGVDALLLGPLHWQGACCNNKYHALEKTTVACVNAMFGQSDPIPAESRWAHMLRNMRKTLLRAVVYRVGLDCFECGDMDAADGQIDIDADAVGGSAGKARAVRSRRTAEYYNDEQHIFQLGVFACLIKTYDSLLLYTLLGDDNDGYKGLGDHCKLDLLLDEKTSNIAECAHQMLEMLRSWRSGGPNRTPWCVLDFLGAPMQDSEFMKWARNQIVCLGSSVFRRFETKYAALPYSLYPLCHDRSTEAERRNAAQALLASRAEDLDPYSNGVRSLYPTEAALTSVACRSTLRADFMGRRLATDLIMRLHAEMANKIPKRSPARNFPNLARECLLAQAAVLHVNRGGQHPLCARVAGQASAVERVCHAALGNTSCVGKRPRGGRRDRARSCPAGAPARRRASHQGNEGIGCRR